jgi:hypothetical protein
MIDVFAHGLGTDGGGFDPTVTDDFGSECAKECLALIGGFAEFRHAFAVTDHGERGGSSTGRSGNTCGLGDGGRAYMKKYIRYVRVMGRERVM